MEALRVCTACRAKVLALEYDKGEFLNVLRG